MPADPRDLVGPLRAAIIHADPSWVSQPSRLQRHLEEELGPDDSRQYRARVHQLMVAAEERVPLRLKQNGWSSSERDDLTRLLMRTRGWTTGTAEWAVETWAAALGFSSEGRG